MIIAGSFDESPFIPPFDDAAKNVFQQDEWKKVSFNGRREQLIA